MTPYQIAVAITTILVVGVVFVVVLKIGNRIIERSNDDWPQ